MLWAGVFHALTPSNFRSAKRYYYDSNPPMRKLKQCTEARQAVVVEPLWHRETDSRTKPHPQTALPILRQSHSGNSLTHPCPQGRRQDPQRSSAQGPRCRAGAWPPWPSQGWNGPGVPWPCKAGRGAQQCSLEGWHGAVGVRTAKVAGSPCPHWPGSSCVVTVRECVASVALGLRNKSSRGRAH